LHITQRRCVLSHFSSPSVQKARALLAAKSADSSDA
jgi:hypothetical protein